jgi:hypothetical protein
MTEHHEPEATAGTEYDRGAFVKRMAAAAFAIPVVASFSLDSLAQAAPPKHADWPKHFHGNGTLPGHCYGNGTLPGHGYGNGTLPGHDWGNGTLPGHGYPNGGGHLPPRLQRRWKRLMRKLKRKRRRRIRRGQPG